MTYYKFTRDGSVLQYVDEETVGVLVTNALAIIPRWTLILYYDSSHAAATATATASATLTAGALCWVRSHCARLPGCWLPSWLGSTPSWQLTTCHPSQWQVSSGSGGQAGDSDCTSAGAQIKQILKGSLHCTKLGLWGQHFVYWEIHNLSKFAQEILNVSITEN